ncbi:ankyrin, partial [Choiromyces venosus 120613-1]
GETSLILAAGFGMADIVNLLLRQEAWDLNDADHWGGGDGATYRYTNYELLQLILAREDVNVIELNDRSETPLCPAAKRRKISIVRFLLKDPRTQPNITDEGGRSPLYWAVLNGHADIVNPLL